MNASVTINARAVGHDRIAEALRSGSVDVYLSPEPIPHEDYVNHRAGTEHLVSMVRRGHSTVRSGLTLEQFLGLRHVVLETNEPQGSVVEQMLRARGLARNCHMHVHSFFDMPRVVASTDMICSVPARMAQHFAEAHKLQTFPIPIEGLEVPCYLIWHQRFDPDPGHAWIRNALIELLER